jgi:hypothetical protein
MVVSEDCSVFLFVKNTKRYMVSEINKIWQVGI